MFTGFWFGGTKAGDYWKDQGLSWEDNNKMDLMEIGFDEANWIRLAQDRFQWRTL